MIDEDDVPAGLAAEARRLAKDGEGSPDHVYEGLLAYTTGGETDADLRRLANREAARRLAARYSAVGYRSHDYWLDRLQEEMGDAVGALHEEEIGEIFLTEWRAHVEAMRDWPAVTDNDRLSRAFAALDEDGIVAREDFTCCQRCAGQEIFDEFSPDATPSGFVFFHQQDTETAAAQGALMLGFGGFTEVTGGHGHRVRHAPKGDPSHVATAEKAVAVLRGEGLDAEWPTSANARIRVRMDWRRRTAGR